jgi:hypothetical protein
MLGKMARSDPVGESDSRYLALQLGERLAERNANRRAGRVDELDDHRPSNFVCERELPAAHVDQANRGYRPRLFDN